MNVVCGVLKLYLRELPEPLVPTEYFHSLAKMLGKTRQTPERRATLRSGNIICQLVETLASSYFFFYRQQLICRLVPSGIYNSNHKPSAQPALKCSLSSAYSPLQTSRR